MEHVFVSAEEQTNATFKHVALIGNPGAGKSTILNGLAREPVFQSGISLGGGLTAAVNSYKDDANERYLYDTPGLNDILHAKEAAKELEGLLKKDCSLRICFVVTLEEGRVRPDDAAMVEIILGSVKDLDMNDRFGVIINKVDVDIFEELEKSAEQVQHMKDSLLGEIFTSYWMLIPRDSDLSGKSNQLLMFPEIEEFISSIPVTKPRETLIGKIDATSLTELIENTRNKVLRLQTSFEEKKRTALARHESEMERARKRENELREETGEPAVFKHSASIMQGAGTLEGGITSSHSAGTSRDTTALDITKHDPYNYLRQHNSDPVHSHSDGRSDTIEQESRSAPSGTQGPSVFQNVISLLIKKGMEIMQQRLIRRS